MLSQEVKEILSREIKEAHEVIDTNLVTIKRLNATFKARNEEKKELSHKLNQVSKIVNNLNDSIETKQKLVNETLNIVKFKENLLGNLSKLLLIYSYCNRLLY